MAEKNATQTPTTESPSDTVNPALRKDLFKIVVKRKVLTIVNYRGDFFNLPMTHRDASELLNFISYLPFESTEEKPKTDGKA